MDLIDTQEAILDKIKLLERGREELKARAEAKANAIGEYRKARAKVLIQLRNGVEFDVGGDTIQNPPATLANDIARGICYKEKIAEELAVEQYRNAVTGMQALAAELNGLQTVHRYADKV